jgi:hypothetical protein
VRLSANSDVAVMFEEEKSDPTLTYRRAFSATTRPETDRQPLVSPQRRRG